MSSPGSQTPSWLSAKPSEGVLQNATAASVRLLFDRHAAGVHNPAMVKPVYALVGSDSFLQMQKLNELLSTLGNDVQRLEFEGDRADLPDVLDELRSYAMF